MQARSVIYRLTYLVHKTDLRTGMKSCNTCLVIVSLGSMLCSSMLLLLRHEPEMESKWGNASLPLAINFIEMLNADEMETLYRLFYVFDDVMKRDHVTYCLIFGSLIGSYRHHGVVPWDSDVDVLVSQADRWKIRRALTNRRSGIYTVRIRRGALEIPVRWRPLARASSMGHQRGFVFLRGDVDGTDPNLPACHGAAIPEAGHVSAPSQTVWEPDGASPLRSNPDHARFGGQRIQLRDDLPAVRVQTAGSALCTAGQPVSFCSQGSHGQGRSSSKVCGRGVGTRRKEIEHS